jgi:MSHA biogenesis protein MshM
VYHSHFSLHEPPFSLTPDTAYFFAHPSAQAALNTLLVALRSGEGFVKIVGEVGCGKTLLCRRLLAALAKDCETAYIPNPSLDSRTMLLAVCEELGIRVDPVATGHRVVKELERALLERARAGRRVVLVIDEAQAIPDRTVELLRLVSNIETEKRKLLQIVLFGQPELDARLAQPHLRQLLQRIAFSERIEPLGEEEVAEYVRHRLSVAGAGEARVFEEPALAELSRRSGGVPRLINVIAHKAMMLAFGEGARTIAGRHVVMASDDTPGLGRTSRPRWLGWMFAGAGRERP